jgi:hypothetical protein
LHYPFQALGDFFKIMLSACDYAAPWRMMGRGKPVLEIEITREPARSAVRKTWAQR